MCRSEQQVPPLQGSGGMGPLIRGFRPANDRGTSPPAKLSAALRAANRCAAGTRLYPLALSDVMALVHNVECRGLVTATLSVLLI